MFNENGWKFTQGRKKQTKQKGKDKLYIQTEFKKSWSFFFFVKKIKEHVKKDSYNIFKKICLPPSKLLKRENKKN